MYTGRYTPEQVIRELRKAGLDLYVGEDGAVHGRFREKGKKMTLETRALADEMQSMNDEAAALLMAEEVRTLEGISVSEALSYGERIRAGEMELCGKVTYKKSTGLCSMTVKGGAAG